VVIYNPKKISDPFIHNQAGKMLKRTVVGPFRIVGETTGRKLATF